MHNSFLPKLQNISSMVSISLSDILYSTNALCFWLTNELERIEIKTKRLPSCVLSFCGIISSIGWLIWGRSMSKKGCDRVPWSFVFVTSTSFCIAANVTGKSKSDSLLGPFLLLKPLLFLWVKNVAYSLTYTGKSCYSVLTFKSMRLFHSYRDKKLQNRITFVLLEFTGIRDLT